MENEFGDHIHIFDSFVKYAIKVAEASAFGISLHEYAPRIALSKGLRTDRHGGDAECLKRA